MTGGNREASHHHQQLKRDMQAGSEEAPPKGKWEAFCEDTRQMPTKCQISGAKETKEYLCRDASATTMTTLQ